MRGASRSRTRVCDRYISTNPSTRSRTTRTPLGAKNGEPELLVGIWASIGVGDTTNVQPNLNCHLPLYRECPST